MQNKDQLSVFGGTGFVGGRFCKNYSRECILIPREDRVPKTNNVLFFISTIDNYNVFADPFVDVRTNIEVLIEVLENLKDRQGVVVNFISSWFVYGKVDSLPVSEDVCCNPKGFYSITKRAAEQLLISYCETFGLKYRILRLCNVYGVTDLKCSSKRNALQYLVCKVVSGENINLYNGGSDVRDVMHVDDVCDAINMIITKGRLDEVYNVGSGVPHKFLDMMSYVKKKTGSRSEFISVEPPDFHKVVQVKDMVLNVSKLDKLGFKPSINIENGLDRLVEYYRMEQNCEK